MHVYLFDATTGKFVSHVTCDAPPSKEDLEAANPGLVASLVETPWHTGEDPSGLVATIVDGVVMNAAVPAELTAWLHLEITGDIVLSSSGTRYVQRGGTITFSGSLRDGRVLATSSVIAALMGQTLTYGVELVHILGSHMISPTIQAVNGEFSGSLVVPDLAMDGLYRLRDEDFSKVGPYTVKQADPTASEFKVVRPLS